MNRWTVQALGSAIVGLACLAIVNALVTGHQLASVVMLLATFLVVWAVFFGGAHALASQRLGRTLIAVMIAGLLPAVLVVSVVSGLLRSQDAAVALILATALFAATFVLMRRLLGEHRGRPS